jgi:hypothetical protein
MTSPGTMTLAERQKLVADRKGEWERIEFKKTADEVDTADPLDWLRQCRRADLCEQGRAIYENGGLNLANLTDEQQIEAEDDYRICVRRGSD